MGGLTWKVPSGHSLSRRLWQNQPLEEVLLGRRLLLMIQLRRSPKGRDDAIPRSSSSSPSKAAHAQTPPSLQTESASAASHSSSRSHGWPRETAAPLKGDEETLARTWSTREADTV